MLPLLFILQRVQKLIEDLVRNAYRGDAAVFTQRLYFQLERVGRACQQVFLQLPDIAARRRINCRQR